MITDELRILEDFEKNRAYFRLPVDIKPCIAKLIKNQDNNNHKGPIPFIIACELRRTGREPEATHSILESLSVKESKIRGIAKSIESKDYNYGCPSLEAMDLCLFKHRQECFWYQRIPRKNTKKYKESDFWQYGWPNRLRPAETVVYLAIRETERKRRYRAGSRLYISRKQLSRFTGISPPWIIKCGEKLKEKGLIEFTKGRQHLWYGQASIIKRILPIPKPRDVLY